MKILITGATGFIGRAILDKLNTSGTYKLTTCVRNTSKELETFGKCHSIGDINANTNWSKALGGIDVIIHCAARVHIAGEEYNESLTKFRQTNVDGTVNLARQAAKYGTKRFVFISSIKVNGEKTRINKPFTANDKPNPITPYGISKMEAEQALLAIGKETGMEIVIIRPPLVYGKGAKGNIATLLNLIKKRTPLPFALLRNKRSLVSIDNLTDLITLCLTHPKAANETLLVSDDNDISTADIFRFAAKSMGKRANLLPFPTFMIKLMLTLAGKGEMSQNICGNLQADITKTKELLDWKPPFSVEQGFLKL